MLSHIHVIPSGQGRPLLLLHGWGFDHQIWGSILPTLNQRYTVYRVDLPGFGQTPCMPWTDFKHTLLQQLPSQVAILGWSMGGLIATRLALEHPERVSHLINISSSPHFIASNNWSGIQADNLDSFYQGLKSSPETILQNFIKLQLPKTTQHRPSNIPKQFNLEGLQNGLDILKNWDLRDEIDTLTLPNAYLFGRLDRITPAQTMAIMQKTYPLFHYDLIPKAGHAPFLSHPEHFLNFLNQFIENT
ncbi:MAG: alpha/beta fold hydrolase [Gammaproteobacteria bacterium]|nr:alpha/beta fold hydrolase [Gammaproteobacteria bacterium]